LLELENPPLSLERNEGGKRISNELASFYFHFHVGSPKKGEVKILF
jgi:hypothetical protein